VIVLTTKKANPKTRNWASGQPKHTGRFHRPELPCQNIRHSTDRGYGSAGATSPTVISIISGRRQRRTAGQHCRTDEDQVWGSAYNPNLKVYNWDAFSPATPTMEKLRPGSPLRITIAPISS